jgi:hypothetical protein
MNFFTDSLDLPQNEQRRCFSLGMTNPATSRACSLISSADDVTRCETTWSMMPYSLASSGS